MKQKSNSQSGEIVLGMLGTSFVVLKLCGVINWSWWLVVLPFYGGSILVFIILLIIWVVKKIK